MGYFKNVLIGITDDAEHLLRDLGHEVDEDELYNISMAIGCGGTHELSDVARMIVRALEDAEPETREALFVRACEVIMELDDLAGERVEPIAA